MSTTEASRPGTTGAFERRSVLPWRRQHVDVALAPLIRTFRERHRRADTTRIERAYAVARRAHADQVRRSGEPYISHPLGVAAIVASLGLDDVTVAAALLHDAAEDTSVTIDQIETQFGPEVAGLVDGVTKLDRLQFDSREAQHAATVRKMLVAMAKDLRVIIIKLADRLHNMRTIASLPEEKQQRIAQETIDVYAPLAHRLGIGEIKWQLEDLAFAVLHPKRYAEIEQLVATQSPEREARLADVLAELRDRLAELRIEAEVTGRPKHFWSIYEKMVVRQKGFDEVQDLLGVRVIVGSLKDCYGALGSVHALWRPVQGRFKDYIAMPKFNLYQSLHTTVVGPGGHPIELQIRTREMHHRAEFGVAAHWSYKEGGTRADELAWLQRLVDWQQETEDPAEFMRSLKLDLEPDEVFVFTPKGKVITLPVGATPVDFAYAIHTEVGHRCIGARVNGRLVPLDSTLSSGDAVEIFTSKVMGAGPSRDWLQFARTPRARTKIRQWFSRERRTDAIENGREELAKALRKEGLPLRRLLVPVLLGRVAEAMHYADTDGLFAAIGEHHVSASAVAHRLRRALDGEEREQVPVTARRPNHRARRSQTAGVHVEGLDDVLVRLSRCCTPVPGDEIMGFVTRGRGVSVHRADCTNATGLASAAGERLIEVEWDRDATGTFVVAVEVEALDRPRLLGDVATVLAEHHVNILSSTTQTTPDRVARLRFEFELADPGHLEGILAALARVDGVYGATRCTPGRARAATAS